MRFLQRHRQFALATITAIIALTPPRPMVHAEAESSAARLSPLIVETNFPNGSGKVIEVDQTSRHIRIEPTAHESRGWACWWYVRVSGIEPGEVITLEVGPEPWATPSQATFSIDDRTWRHTAPGTHVDRSIKYQQKVDATIAWFAWGPPFTVNDATELVDRAKQACEEVHEFLLCETREGRSVPAMRFQPRAVTPTSAIWVQARQHAWEAGSSWVCKGFVEWLVSEDPRAARLRSTTTVTVVPIMDVDNVAIGAGGKNQVPHDHNRDWSEQPHWRSVAEAMQALRRFDDAGQLDLFVDLHNPGASTTRPFYYVAPRQLMTDLRQRNLDRFLAASRIEMTGPLQFVGEIRESGPEYDVGWKQISKNWVTLNTRDHVVAATLETAWNTPHSTIDGYQTVGRQLGLAIERYLQLEPQKDTSQETKPGQRIR
ncbi:MAG TPA: M14-type cytosolic carboxypeptidase [Pirellulaceae bacterium]|nr:M14-type cytosolic carboxypeptidase [Pirellulaceae bacterium]